jgi:tryptophan synthase beta chain
VKDSAPQPASQRFQVSLSRNLGLFDVTMIGVGAMIGAGIFALTGQMAQMTGVLFPLAFLAAAVIVSFSAYSYIKISNAYPSAGGIGMYLHKAYGNRLPTAFNALLMYFSMVIAQSFLARRQCRGCWRFEEYFEGSQEDRKQGRQEAGEPAKFNNALGQALLVKRMGKTRIITETGAGQNGVAVATVCAKFGFDCTVYMGEEDIARQRPNVFWMENLGAKVVPVTSGTKTLKDAVNEALRDWITNVKNTHYMIGSALGAAPFPEMVKEFQKIIGQEAKSQLRELENNPEILPNKLIACVGGGSNSIGLFADFIPNENVELIGVEAGGDGVDTGKHAARFGNEKDAKIGIVQGYKSIFLQTKDGQLRETSSVSAGLDYAGIGPEHAHLQKIGRVKYTNATDKEAISALKTVMKYEGMIPALESSHAWAEALKQAKKMNSNEILIVNQSGRGDKDIFIVADALADEKWFDFLKSKVNS